jgi:cytidine deaminase
MKRENINEADKALITQARELIRTRKKENRHSVSAVLRTNSGKVFEGIHLEAYVGRIAVCAEAIAIGQAAVDGDTEIETIVAVYKDGEIVSPCGMCRELISDYSPEARIILKDESGEFKVRVDELLPLKFNKD